MERERRAETTKIRGEEGVTPVSRKPGAASFGVQGDGPASTDQAPANARGGERFDAWLANQGLMAALGLPEQGEKPGIEGSPPKEGDTEAGPASSEAAEHPASLMAPLDHSLPPEILAAQALKLGMAGQQVELPYRDRIEQQLGRPLSGVRCFTGPMAQQACEAVGARAFVVADVMILAESQPPFEIVMHEAIHLLQQSGSSIGAKPPGAIPMGEANDAQEQQAHALAEGEGREDASSASLGATSPKLSGFFYLSGCTPAAPAISTGPKGVSNADGNGWLNVRFDSGVTPLPWYLKVNQTSRTNNRDEFEVLEGRHKGKKGTVAEKSSSESHLEAGLSYGSAATVTMKKGAKQMIYGGTTIAAFTQPSNPLPSGTHEIQIPDEPHGLGASYGAYATSWFRLGTSGDRYLHPGSVSLGCATVSEIDAWPALYSHLINRRQSATAVGTLTVTD